LGLRFGPYGAKLNPFSQRLTLAKLKDAPHGIDLGALDTCLPKRLCTASKHINLAPEVLVKDLERIKEKLLNNPLENQSYDLLLIGRRHLRSNNSWMHNSLRLIKGRPLCTLLMHTTDAAHRHIQSGQKVSVRSRVGCIEIPVEITDDIMPGTVSIPHGWGHDRDGILLEVAKQNAGASINDLTDELSIDAVCGAAAFSGTWVRVEM
ncbi:MAG: molybdopterin dinucleotide binding domain-containing protein, partial [Acidobacteriota bacterium]